MSVDELKMSRKGLMSRITRINSYASNKFDPLSDDISELEVRLEEVKKIWSMYDDIQGQLETIDPSNEIHREIGEDKYFTTVSLITKLIKQLKISYAQTPMQTLDTRPKINLPQLKIPQFDGKYDQWKSFIEIFKAVIDSNDSVSDIEKLFYLKSNLKGEALRVIEGVSVSSEAYKTCLDLLTERFDNKYLIINSHLKALFDLPSVSKDATNTLRSLIVETKQHLRSIKAFDIKTEEWDPIIIFMLTQKLDNSTRTAWELQKPHIGPSSLDDLYKFIEHRCASFETISTSDKSQRFISQPHLIKNKAVRSFVTGQDKTKCSICNNDFHNLYYCKQFIKLSPKKRLEATKNAKMCTNCLRRGHGVNDCYVKSYCKKCNNDHHTLLHEDKNSETSLEVNQEASSSTSTCLATNRPNSHVVLSTIELNVMQNGQPLKCRAILDNASQPNLITASFVRNHNLKPFLKTVPVVGIRNLGTETSQAIRLTISSQVCQFRQSLEFLVVDVITTDVPSHPMNAKAFHIPKHIKLADPNFAEPGPIDMLIGGELFAKVIGPTKYKLGNDLPYIIQTAFGWIISGKVSMNSESHFDFEQQSLLISIHPNSLDHKLRQFWEIEHAFNEFQPFSIEEKLCEKHYDETTTRNPNGRYIVQFPLRNSPDSLGESYSLALHRLEQMERKFEKQPQIKDKYLQFMSEYLQLNHMELVTDDTKHKINYLSHHAVFKDKKIRVVFDGSMKTTNGVSLNDIMVVGPTVQQDLFSIMVRFRKHKVAFTTDITKMYRQILVDKPHTDLQRILWRNDKNDKVNEYRLNTVTYGTASAPYLATKTVQRLALDENHRYPYASNRIIRDTYVDDVMTGAETIEEALILQQQIIELFNTGGFTLHKWCSNFKEILCDIPDKQDSVQKQVKTLGLIWTPETDMFQFSVNTKHLQSMTKREILSDIATIFDPLGILGPVILQAKVFIQQLWKLQAGWDEPLDEPLVNQWKDWKKQLPLISCFQIPRCINPSANVAFHEIHGFCDASEVAYGAAIYLKTTDCNGISTVRLITSKSRVAPIKTTTIPRLELNGALILSQLKSKIIKALEMQISSITLWTDSSIVLSWLSEQPNKWTTYVAHRVARIQDRTSECTWRHIKSDHNPADILSRGSDITTLQSTPLWWEGPSWLSHDQIHWPESATQAPSILPDIKTPKTISLLTNMKNCDIFTKYSSLTKLVRVTTYCYRFINNAKAECNIQVPTKGEYSTNLTPSEIHDTKLRLIKLAQQESFHEEMHCLTINKALPKCSKLLSLHPFLDSENMLRIGGRLTNSNLPYEQIHPLILPEKHPLTKLLITHEHMRLLHAGQQAVLTSLRRNYWPINARNQIRNVIHHCVTCFKFRAKGSQQIMAPLPSERVTQSLRPFLNTGLDYAGPVFIKSSKRRNAPHDRAYIAVFICLATRAIHLELVASLTTESLLLALNRFISRRGICAKIMSDNGTNFKGASNELHELYHLFRNQESKRKIIDYVCVKGIKWTFIPPNSPHFGGIWEAGVKSCKHHLRRTIGSVHLTFEETYTLLTQIEACLNSRPLTPINSDPSNCEFISPGHFLIGDLLTHIPMPNYTEIHVNTLSRWQLVQRLHQQFWSIWSKDYLSELQVRNKWKTIQPNLMEGKLVIVREDNTPPLTWPTARITEVIIGPDGKARSAIIITSKGNKIHRPIVKLCPLPIYNTE